MNDVIQQTFKPIRCGRHKPTPYLRKYLPTIPEEYKYKLLVDLGCGNLRNSGFANSIGYENVLSFDKAGDYGIPVDLGSERIPVRAKKVSVILCNYLICFLNNEERKHLFSEIDRIATKGCYIFMEMYPAKQGTPYNTNEIRMLFVGWKTIRFSKDRFILQKE